MKQQQFEALLYLERKEAMKIKKIIDKAGFVEAQSKVLSAKLPLDNFRVVIYHEALKNVIQEKLGKHINWTEKQLTP